MASDPDDWWLGLVTALDAWTRAAETAPGRIEVALPDSGRRVVVVMTPEEWDDMVDIMFGRLEPALDDVKQTLLRLEPHESYAVYCQYRLEPSTGPTLPRSDDQVPTGPGEWVAHDREGRVLSRFSEWRDPSEDP